MVDPCDAILNIYSTECLRPTMYVLVFARVCVFVVCVCMYMCVCMCVCMRVHVHVHVHVHVCDFECSVRVLWLGRSHECLRLTMYI